MHRSRACGFIALLTLALSAVAAPSATGVRMIAEWEPALGVLITYPFGLPNALVAEMAQDDHLYILTNNAAEDSACGGLLSSLGVPASRYTLIRSGNNSHWTRDWGPHQAFVEGQWTIIDPLFAGYPWVGPGCDLVASPGGYVGDNAAPIDVANFFGAPIVPLPAYLVGGNFLNNGHATAFATCTQIGENLQLGNEALFRQRIANILGITEFIALAPTEDVGIQHIDCWFKPLDEETLLVKRAPMWHEEYTRIESNVAQLQTLTNVYGRPYRILRIDCMPYSGENIATYLNSLILNKKIYVPLFDIPEDAAALATWREAMPGYEVIGFPYNAWYYYDALHCRTRAIFDKHMLRITHRRLDAVVPPAASYPIAVQIDDYSAAGLVTSSLKAHYRAAGQHAWQSVALLPGGAPGQYVAELPSFPPGTPVEYYLAAASQSGRSETLPRVAPAGAYRFKVAEAGIAIALVSPPRVVVPWVETPIDVQIDLNGETLTPGSAWLHVRYGANGPSVSRPLAWIGGSAWRGMLPPFVCGDQPEFYVSVAGATYGVKTAPFGGAQGGLRLSVGSLTPVSVYQTSFESGLPAGWATTGLWSVTTSCALDSSCDGVRWAYFGQTGNCRYSNGARVRGALRAPLADLPPLPPGATATFTYCSALNTEGQDGFDLAGVYVNGVLVDTPAESSAWETRVVDLSSHVGTPMQVEFRFDSIDQYYNSFRGWQVDQVELRTQQVACDSPLPFSRGDANCDGVVSFSDIDAFVLALGDPSAYVAANPACHWRSADCNSDGLVNFSDIDAFVAAIGQP